MTLTRRVAAGAAAPCSPCRSPPAAATNLAAARRRDAPRPRRSWPAAKAALDETSRGRALALDRGRAPRRRLPARAPRASSPTRPAFQGTAGGRFLGFDAEGVEVRSVDGDFYVNAPIIGWDTYDPAELCAPDPATLLDPDTGVSGVLVAATDLEAGEQRRAEDDNSVVVTPYTATVPGDGRQVDPALRPRRLLRRDLHRRRRGSAARRRPDRGVLLRRRRHHLHDRDHRLRRRPGDHRSRVRPEEHPTRRAGG